MQTYRKLSNLERVNKVILDHNADYIANLSFKPEDRPKYQAFVIEPNMFLDLKEKSHFKDYDLSGMNKILKQFAPTPTEVSSVLALIKDLTIEKAVIDKFRVIRDDGIKVRYLCDEIIVRDIELQVLQNKIKKLQSNQIELEKEIKEKRKKEKDQREDSNVPLAQKGKGSKKSEPIDVKTVEVEKGLPLDVVKKTEIGDNTLIYSKKDVEMLKASQTKSIQEWESKVAVLKKQLSEMSDYEDIRKDLVLHMGASVAYVSKISDLITSLREEKEKSKALEETILLLKQNSKAAEHHYLSLDTIHKQTVKEKSDLEDKILDQAKRLAEMVNTNQLNLGEIEVLKTKLTQSMDVNNGLIEEIEKRKKEDYNQMLLEIKRQNERMDQATNTEEDSQADLKSNFVYLADKLTYLNVSLDELKQEAKIYFGQHFSLKKVFLKKINQLKKMFRHRLSADKPLKHKNIQRDNKEKGGKENEDKQSVQQKKEEKKRKEEEKEEEEKEKEKKEEKSEGEKFETRTCKEIIDDFENFSTTPLTLSQELSDMKLFLDSFQKKFLGDLIERSNMYSKVVLKEELKELKKELSNNQLKVTSKLSSDILSLRQFGSASTETKPLVSTLTHFTISPSKQHQQANPFPTKMIKSVDRGQAVSDRLQVLLKLPISYENNLLLDLSQEDREIFAFHFILTDVERLKMGQWWVHSCYMDNRHMLRSLEMAMTKWVVCSRGA
jgi:hypothetical protein